MIQLFFINIQSPHAGEKSINCYNGKLIDSYELQRLNLVDKIIPDNSYKILFKIQGCTVYKKYRKNDNHYIIYGHLEEKDDCGRFIPFNCYTRTNKNITQTFCLIESSLSQYGYSLNKDESYAVNNKINKIHNKHMRLYISIGIAITILASISIYHTIKKNNQTNDNESETEQHY